LSYYRQLRPSAGVVCNARKEGFMKYFLELKNYWSKIDIDKSKFLPAGAGAITINKVKNIAYLYGGLNYKMNLKKYSNKLYKLDLNNESFELIDELNIKNRFNHKMFYTKNNKLCILGGFNNVNEDKPLEYCDEILLYDISTKKIENISISPGLMKRGQFTASMNFEENIVYVFGGFNNSDFFKIDLSNKCIVNLEPVGDKFNSRAGMISEVLPNGNYFIFSGFNNIDKKSICYNDYYIYNPQKNEITKNECNENVGRTFAKSFVYEDLKKIIIFGGSPNGMEGSGSIYFYDYEKDFFNIAYIQELPKSRVEPFVIFSKQNKKMYVISGLEPDGKNYNNINEIMVLDFNKIDNEAWLGHP